jgi:recombinational DNA repair ATPase RecF
MYVKEIFISEFRNLKNVKLGPFTQKDDKSELVVLAGPNGSGKTSIMELLGSTLSSILGTNLQFKRNMSFIQRYKVLIGIHASELLRMQKYLDSMV